MKSHVISFPLLRNLSIGLDVPIYAFQLLLINYSIKEICELCKI